MKYIFLIIGVFFLGSSYAEEHNKIQFEKKYPRTSTWIETEPNSRLESFRDSAKRNPTTKKDMSVNILSCEKLVTVNVSSRRGNISYGGICTIKYKDETNTAFICDDEMVGTFYLQNKDENQLSVDHLIQFVYDHCYGG